MEEKDPPPIDLETTTSNEKEKEKTQQHQSDNIDKETKIIVEEEKPKEKREALKSKADHIYILVKDYTFYKTERVLWYFKHLLSSASSNSTSTASNCIKITEKDEGIVVLYCLLDNGKLLDLFNNYNSILSSTSIIHHHGYHKKQITNDEKQDGDNGEMEDDDDDDDEDDDNENIIFYDKKTMKLPFVSLIPKTQVSVVSSTYRFVFSLDMSPSMSTVDPISGRVLIDELISSLDSILISLSLPLNLPNMNDNLTVSFIFKIQTFTHQ